MHVIYTCDGVHRYRYGNVLRILRISDVTPLSHEVHTVESETRIVVCLIPLYISHCCMRLRQLRVPFCPPDLCTLLIVTLDGVGATSLLGGL